MTVNSCFVFISIFPIFLPSDSGKMAGPIWLVHVFLHRLGTSCRCIFHFSEIRVFKPVMSPQNLQIFQNTQFFAFLPTDSRRVAVKGVDFFSYDIGLNICCSPGYLGFRISSLYSQLTVVAKI